MGFIRRLFGSSDTRERQDASTFSDDEDDFSDSLLDDVSIMASAGELNLEQAIESHEAWKVRLRKILEGTSTEKLDPSIVCLDDQCDLGKWLRGPGLERLGHAPFFSALVSRHRSFHLQAAQVLSLAHAGEKAKAEQMFKTSYRHSSNQVVLLLKALHKEDKGG